MQSATSLFDYQAVLEACGIQDVNVNNALQQRAESDAKFREELETVKNLRSELTEKNEKLSDLKLTKKKHLHKFNKAFYKTAALNKELKLVQDETGNLQLELQKQSDEFITKITNKDEELKSLYSQFEGETLMSMINEANTELLYYRELEMQLEQQFVELKNSLCNINEYERLPVLKTIIDEFSEIGNVQEIEKKVADKKKNIQFLESEYNKKMELLQKFD